MTDLLSFDDTGRLRLDFKRFRRLRVDFGSKGFVVRQSSIRCSLARVVTDAWLFRCSHCCCCGNCRVRLKSGRPFSRFAQGGSPFFALCSAARPHCETGNCPARTAKRGAHHNRAEWRTVDKFDGKRSGGLT